MPLSRTLALLVALHASIAAHAAAAERPVTIRYFLGWTLGAGDQDVIQEFERRNPGIKVVAGLPASWDAFAYGQRLLRAIADGDSPDLAAFDRWGVALGAAGGAFMALDGLLQRDRERPDGVQPDEFYPSCWHEVQWQGKTYAVPSGVDNRALYYNRKLLRAAGLVDAEGEARPPRTWEELDDYALKLSELTRDAQGAITGIRRIGFIPNYGNAWFYFYSWLNDGQLLSPDGRRCTLAAPENVEAMQYVTDLYDKLGGARLVYAFQSTFQGAELDPFLMGRVAMKIDGNWVLGGIARFRRGLDFGVAPAPMPRRRLDAGKPHISWVGGWSWVIPKGARHPEEAWRLIRWLASEEATRIVHDAAREANQAQGKLFIPGLNANKRITRALYRRYLDENPEVEGKFRDAYQVFMNLLLESRCRPVTPIAQFLWDQQVRALEAAIYHQGSVKEVLAKHAGEVQRELDRCHRARGEPQPDGAKEK